VTLLARRRPTTLLCDADGNLFPSEEPAFDASVVVMRRFLAEHGVMAPLDPGQLRRQTTGKNFRTTAAALAAAHGIDVAPEVLEQWVREERDVVTKHLAGTLRPDPEVFMPLSRLSGDYVLVAVSSSATPRLAACFAATALDELIPADRRFSAEDSLPLPKSKPDPEIYVHACAALGVAPGEAVAIEDSVPGARSAVAAGVPTIGNVQFVPADERADRAAELTCAGVVRVAESWAEVESLVSENFKARTRVT
jgi:beta-phosphoglucomutase-like phosphatase (HAD superfamily)